MFGSTDIFSNAAAMNSLAVSVGKDRRSTDRKIARLNNKLVILKGHYFIDKEMQGRANY